MADTDGDVTDLELSWAEVPDVWVPGRPFTMGLALANHGGRSLDLPLLEGPNRALAFSLARPGEAPSWRASPAAAALAGVQGDLDLGRRGSLSPGGRWTTEEELAAYWLPPLPGQYELRARFAADAGSVEAPPRPLRVPEAGLVAAAAVRQRAVEDLLVQAWGDGGRLWLRVASGRYPLAPRWLREVGPWPGAGELRIARQGFSPLDDPPISAYRFWVVWVHGAPDRRLGAALVDYLGQVQRRLDLPVPTDGRLLTPVQREDGALLLPLLGADSVAWWRLPADADDPQHLTDWPVPAGARNVDTAAFPDGRVAQWWVTEDGLAVGVASGDPEQGQRSALEAARFEAGEVVFAEVMALRGGPTVSLVHLTREDDHVYLAVHRVGPGGDRVMPPVAAPDRPLPVKAAWLGQQGAVLLRRDAADRLWVAAAGPKAEWNVVPHLRGGEGFGVTASLVGSVVWAADADLGLRVVPVSVFGG